MKNSKFKTLFLIFSIIILTLIFPNNVNALENVLLEVDNSDIVYLSDIPYKTASVGWGNLSFNKTQSNTPLTLKVNGNNTVFDKGIWAHADSEIVYNISEYKDHAYLITYYGINTTAKNAGDGVKFYVYTSVNGENWTLKSDENPTPMKVVNNAVYLKIDIRGANYVKLKADKIDGNASDNSIWADTKLVKEGFSDELMIPVSEFDTYIKNNYNGGVISEDLSLTLLQRNFIYKVGQPVLKEFLEEKPEHRDTLEWFLYDEEALRLWTMGGAPNGTYIRSLRVLSDLYQTYKDTDLKNENLTTTGMKFKDLYLKMILSLSLSHSTNITLWADKAGPYSDPITRYEIYKDLHINNKLRNTAMFENLEVAEMRIVTLTNISDEEIMWLHDYSEEKFSNLVDRFNPFKYIKYTLSYSYRKPEYTNPENYEKWNQIYKTKNHNIPYPDGRIRLWTVFKEGAVCGGLSKTAANLYGVWGYPARVVGQPGHAAFIYLEPVGGNKLKWQLSYNVASYGWAQTGGASAPSGYGNKLGLNSGSYLFISQEMLNEYDKYEKASMMLLLENVYKNDREKLYQLYKDVLEEEIINLNAWVGLINLYIADDTKTDTNLLNLAEKIADVYKYQPLPMYDLTTKIGTKITGIKNKSRLLLLQEKTLKNTHLATASDTLYYDKIPIVADAILGIAKPSLATFSFDGENAGKIMLSKQFQGTGVTWSYSLDNKKTWTEVYEDSKKLNNEELASISEVNDIKIRISGLALTDDNIFTIDITKRNFTSSSITVNDEYNRLLGVTNEMEWTLDLNDEWNSFSNTNPVFNGNKTVYVRVPSSGTAICSNPVSYEFTENIVDETRKFIPSKNVEVSNVSTTSLGNKNYLLDGDLNTFWRCKGLKGSIELKLDEEKFITSIEFYPDKNAVTVSGGTTGGGSIPYGNPQKIKVSISKDGNTWEEVITKENSDANSKNMITINFKEPKQALYIKLDIDSYHSLPDAVAVSELKLYENTVVDKTPRAELNYSIERPTNKNVTVELINPTRPITVTNNGGKTSYTFTKNGKFTFEFVDENGNVGSTTASVNWIDKSKPKATVTYSRTESTNDDIVATITFDKEVTILSKDVPLTDNPTNNSKTITFTDNGQYTLKFMDNLGNINTQLIKVDNIDTVNPTAEIEFNTMTLTKGEVIATLVPSEDVIVTNNNGKMTHTFKNNGSFTFEFRDMAGNLGEATATVSWIGTIPTYEVKYSTKKLTNKDVTATINIESGFKLVDENNTITYSKNGEYEVQYMDRYGNTGIIPIKINWIDKTAPRAELSYKKVGNKVIVSVVNASEKITFKEGNGVYEYSENGTYEIVFYDKAMNEGKVVAIVNIEKEEQANPPVSQKPIDSVKPSIPNTSTDNDSTNIDTDDNSNKVEENNPDKDNDKDKDGNNNPDNDRIINDSKKKVESNKSNIIAYLIISVIGIGALTSGAWLVVKGKK